MFCFDIRRQLILDNLTVLTHQSSPFTKTTAADCYRYMLELSAASDDDLLSCFSFERL